MNEDIGAPEQGFSGPLVEHDDYETGTKDWRIEYGPDRPDYVEIVKICKKYPDNTWCRKHLPRLAGIPNPQKQRQAEGGSTTKSGLFAVLLAASMLMV